MHADAALERRICLLTAAGPPSTATTEASWRGDLVTEPDVACVVDGDAQVVVERRDAPWSRWKCMTVSPPGGARSGGAEREAVDVGGVEAERLAIGAHVVERDSRRGHPPAGPFSAPSVRSSWRGGAGERVDGEDALRDRGRDAGSVRAWRVRAARPRGGDRGPGARRLGCGRPPRESRVRLGGRREPVGSAARHRGGRAAGSTSQYRLRQARRRSGSPSSSVPSPGEAVDAGERPRTI